VTFVTVDTLIVLFTYLLTYTHTHTHTHTQTQEIPDLEVLKPLLGLALALNGIAHS